MAFSQPERSMATPSAVLPKAPVTDTASEPSERKPRRFGPSWFLVSPSVALLLLWMLVPLSMTVYFSVIRYNLLYPGENGFVGLEIAMSWLMSTFASKVNNDTADCPYSREETLTEPTETSPRKRNERKFFGSRVLNLTCPVVR